MADALISIIRNKALINQGADIKVYKRFDKCTKLEPKIEIRYLIIKKYSFYFTLLSQSILKL